MNNWRSILSWKLLPIEREEDIPGYGDWVRIIAPDWKLEEIECDGEEIRMLRMLDHLVVERVIPEGLIYLRVGGGLTMWIPEENWRDYIEIIHD
jgi:hypothetical protein